MVRALAKPGEDIQASMSGADWSLLAETITATMIQGLRLDQIKKQVVYEKNLGYQAMKAYSYPENLTPEKCHLLHMALGIAGEAAEILEAVFFHVAHDAPLDLDNLIEESGDVDFYHEGLRQGAGINRTEALMANISKLSTGKNARYSSGYSNEAAQTRADKA